MMRRSTLLASYLALVCLFGGLAGRAAQAHVFAPALLELRELGDNRVTVRWKQPQARALGSVLTPVLPSACVVTNTPQSVIEGTGLVSNWLLTCPGSLVGETLVVKGIAESGADVLLRIALEDGRTLQHVLKAEAPLYIIPERQSAVTVAADYARIGTEHILSGWDHLLFVLGLVLLVGSDRKLLWTVTAFTVGHSITLVAAVLGFVSAPQAPIEALIALSIYFLAVELVRSYAGFRTFMQRAPWLVAGGFGLLHGLGFAGALTEVGLPANEIPLALFSFNVGIEVGQLAFVALVLLVWAGIRRIDVPWPRGIVYVPAYGIGSLAAFWFFERLAGILPLTP